MQTSVDAKPEESIRYKVMIDQTKSLEKGFIASSIAIINIDLLAIWLSRNSLHHEWIFALMAIKTLFNFVLIGVGLRLRKQAITTDNVHMRLRSLTIIAGINSGFWLIATF